MPDDRSPSSRPGDDALASAYRRLLNHHVAVTQDSVHPPGDHCASPTLRFNIESPRNGNAASGELEIRGWCFDLRAEIDAIGIWIDDAQCPCESGLQRSDVGASYPDVPRANASGFRARADLAPGPHFLSIRAVVADAAEVVLHETVISVADSRMVCMLEAPALDRLRAGGMRFSGWCWHRDAEIVSLQLHACGTVADCRHGLLRDDVAHSFPEVATARRSGFACDVELSRGGGIVALEAVLADGRRARTLLSTEARVRARLIDARALAPLRERAARLRQAWTLSSGWIRRRGRPPRMRELPALMRKAHAVLRPMAAGGAPTLPVGWHPPARRDPYEVWQDLNRWTPTRELHLRRRLASMYDLLPVISIVMPIYNPDQPLLDRALSSVWAQVYEGWELCIADDGSTDTSVRHHLESAMLGDPRIRLVLRETNGNISAATNSAAALATGAYLLFLDQDDELPPDSLAEIAIRVAQRPETDLLYTDDDKIDVDGRRHSPQFKPDWSPELLLSYMYISHALVVRRSLFERCGGFRIGLEGSQDHDFALRASEAAQHVEHLSSVLYHWRVTPGSMAQDANAKPAAFAAGERAVREALSRRGSAGSATRPPWAVRNTVGAFTHAFPDAGPRVTLIVPTRNQHGLLRRCLDSLVATKYRNYDVIVVDNDSDDPQTLAYLDQLPHRVLRIASPERRFNFSHINNAAAASATGEFVLFLNNDTEVRDPRWLSQMVGYAQLPGVGAVGARLVYPDGRIQHAGVLHGLHDGLVGHAFRLAPADDPGYLWYSMVARNYSAVSAACMLTRKALFRAQGGFDETNFAVAYNDVDYCYRLVDAGYRCVYAPGAELLHHEGYSRGFEDHPQEIVAFRAKYRVRRDPYYSPHLSLDDGRFALKPRRWPPLPRNSPIRALMCGFTLNWEGAPYQQLELALALKRIGFLDPVVYATRDGPLRAEYESNGITVFVTPHPLRDAGTVAEYLRAVDRFADWIVALDVDLVYANTMESFFAVAAAERAQLPSVWNIHESESWQSYFAHLPAAIAGSALDCFAYPYRVVFVSHATRARYAALESRHHFVTIHNGIDPVKIAAVAATRPRAQGREELGIARNDLMLLVLGTVCARKGQHDLVHALSGLDETLRARIRCYIVGDRPGDYSTDLHALVARLPPTLRGHVHVVPETDDTALYYNAADIFVCTSRVESYPRVILEAMAYGLPIISTPVFGIREQIRANVNGLFYEPGDIAALRIAIARLAQDDVLRARFAHNTGAVLDGLPGYDEMVAAYADVFSEACAARIPADRTPVA